MSKILGRRSFITAGLATAAGASGLGAAVYLADRYGLVPPDHAGIVGVGKRLPMPLNVSSPRDIRWLANSNAGTFRRSQR